MNTPVSFQLAKLLKEKGFSKHCPMIYNTDGELSNVHFSVFCQAPTIADVVMWFYEKHNLWIRLHPVNYVYSNPSLLLDSIEWCYVVTKVNGINLKWKKEDRGGSITEAYEKAIDYCLKII